jgi:hypothetical protein
MNMLRFIFSGLAAMVLLAEGLSSCQKEGALPASATGIAKAQAGIIALPPPTYVAWVPGKPIPYTSGIPGDAPKNEWYSVGFAIKNVGFVLCGMLG